MTPSCWIRAIGRVSEISADVRVVDVADPLELVAWLALFARCSAQVSLAFERRS